MVRYSNISIIVSNYKLLWGYSGAPMWLSLFAFRQIIKLSNSKRYCDIVICTISTEHCELNEYAKFNIIAIIGNSYELLWGYFGAAMGLGLFAFRQISKF